MLKKSLGTIGNRLHCSDENVAVMHQKEFAMAVRWEDLTPQEQNTLVTMSHSPLLTLSVELTERLELLGLAERGLSGTIISAAGRQLIWRRPKKELEE